VYTRCNGAPTKPEGVDNMAKIRNTETKIEIVKPVKGQIAYKRTTDRYGKPRGSWSCHVQFLLVGRGAKGRFVSLRV